jgi:hypothetical protein
MRCPICGLDSVRVTGSSDRPEAKVVCRRCSEFRIDDIFLGDFGSVRAELKPYLSMYTRICAEEGRRPQVIDESNIAGLADTYRNTTVAAKMDRLLALMGRRTTFAGETVPFDCDIDYPAIAAKNRPECVFLVTSLADLGLITRPMDASTVEGPDIMTEGCLRVTAAGWQRLSASDHPSSSGRCFVAMSFDHSMDAAYENGIRPAVEDDAKYEACRVDRVHHLEKICDKIVNEIRRSQFIVADVSQHKPGVYFEAGFAMALNRPVIWTCREEDFDLIHFDTRQYNHIKWTTPEDLRQQLADRILATIGRRLPN